MAIAPLIEVTSMAAQKIEEVLNEQSEGHTMLRVIATPGPEGSLQYALGSDDHANDDDVVIDTETVKILIDSESAPLIEGSQIDYVDSLMRSGFVISNPNAAGGGGCGCGGH
jgi:iron-sulfur cluster assembly protein